MPIVSPLLDIGGGLIVEQGALYPALYRLATEWGISDNNRKAKFYALQLDPPGGRR